MNKDKFFSSNKVIIGIISIFVLVLPSFSSIMGNCSDSGYICTGLNGESMKADIESGSAYFLSAYSDFMKALSQMELSGSQGVNYKELSDILSSAISNMEVAESAYSSLVKQAQTTPYNPSVIDRLKSFDYKGFQQKKGLNSTIFDIVAGSLGEGDIANLYMNMGHNAVLVGRKIIMLKSIVDNNMPPELKPIQEVNQLFSETILTGQYMSEVFEDILEIK